MLLLNGEIPTRRDLVPASVGLLHIPAGFPNSAIALEATAKAQLPNTLALADPGCVFNVSKNVPEHESSQQF